VSDDDGPADEAREPSLAARNALVHLLVEDLATPGRAGIVACARHLIEGADGTRDAHVVAAARDALLAARALPGSSATNDAVSAARARLAAYAELLELAPRGDSLPVRLAQARRMFARELFFEVHEVLEPPWRDATGEERTILQGVIQASIGWHHARRRNDTGARRLAAAALDKLVDAPERWHGFPVDALRTSLRAFLDDATRGGSTRPPPLAWASDDAG